MATKISFKLHGRYQDMVLQLEAAVDKEGWEIYHSQVAIRNKRIEEHKAEVMEKGESSVKIPGIPFPPVKLTKEEICRRVFIKWMESQLVNPEQVTLGDSDERSGDTGGNTSAVPDSEVTNSTTLADQEESAVTT